MHGYFLVQHSISHNHKLVHPVNVPSITYCCVYLPLQTCGAEYIGPGTSPLQCVVNFYNLVTSTDSTLTKETLTTHEVLSLDGKCIKYTADLIEELINVVWLLLGHGAEVNVRDTEMKTPLHTTLLRSCDLRMAQALCDNGADLLASDCLGNTPLMSLCCPLPWRDSIEQGPCLDNDISEAVRFLLSFENVKVGRLFVCFCAC